jgi:hypothetical protein
VVQHLPRVLEALDSRNKKEFELGIVGEETTSLTTL